MLRHLNKLTSQSTLLLPQTVRPLRVAHRREPLHDFENERKAFKTTLKDIRVQHKQDYWNTQTQVENEYLRTYKEERVTKMADDMARWRTQICNISLMTEKKMTALQKREHKLLATMRN